MPAIHKNKQEVSDTFAKATWKASPHHGRGRPDPDRAASPARRVSPRRHGALRRQLRGGGDRQPCLVENEGNGRMCTTVPKVHVAITGIEKVVECPIRRAAPLQRPDPLGHRSGHHHLLQRHQRPAPGRGAGRPGRGAPGAARQRPQPGLPGRGAAQDLAVHPLRRLHEPLPGLHPHRRPRLWHHLPGAHRQNHLPICWGWRARAIW